MSQAEQDKDWLDPDRDEQLAKQRTEGLRIANLYLVFEQDPRGKELLEQWRKGFGRKRTPTHAPIAEYAANEAMRAFIDEIENQVELAKVGLDIT